MGVCTGGVVSTGGVMGVFVQLGGQTPLKLAQQLADAGVPILGTSFDEVDDRDPGQRLSIIVLNGADRLDMLPERRARPRSTPPCRVHDARARACARGTHPPRER